MDSDSDTEIIADWFYSGLEPPSPLPFPTEGHQIFECPGCLMQFVFERTYKYHFDRELEKITYKCKDCNATFEFRNKCKLLAHLKSHTSTIMTVDFKNLTLRPLPLEHFTQYLQEITQEHEEGQVCNRGLNQLRNPFRPNTPLNLFVFVCPECKESISYDDETELTDVTAKHIRRLTGIDHKCHVCLYTLPNKCALHFHMEAHFRKMPLTCCDCGKFLKHHENNLTYPYKHGCEGFREMNVHTRVKCPVGDNCPLLHPSDFKVHLIKKHMSTFCQCSICDVQVHPKRIDKHLLKHKRSPNAIYQAFTCEVCGETFKAVNLRSHLIGHDDEAFVFPCWDCHKIYHNATELVNHAESCEVRLKNISNDMVIYVEKTCENCQKTYTFEFTHSQITTPPPKCPDCIEDTPSYNVNIIKCPMCSKEINYNSDINDHFTRFHRMININPKVILRRCDDKVKKISKERKEFLDKILKAYKQIVGQYAPANRPAKSIVESDQLNTTVTTTPLQATKPWECIKCNDVSFSHKEQLEEHFRNSHKDSNGSYQCMECGDCFYVKQLFATHMKHKHNISGIEMYIFNKNMEVERAPVLNEFNCRVCFKSFQNDKDLKGHFRSHGMAYLSELSKAKKNLMM